MATGNTCTSSRPEASEKRRWRRTTGDSEYVVTTAACGNTRSGRMKNTQVAEGHRISSSRQTRNAPGELYHCAPKVWFTLTVSVWSDHGSITVKDYDVKLLFIYTRSLQEIIKNYRDHHGLDGASIDQGLIVIRPKLIPLLPLMCSVASTLSILLTHVCLRHVRSRVFRYRSTAPQHSTRHSNIMKNGTDIISVYERRLILAFKMKMNRI